MGDSHNGWFIMENPILKLMIWGYPHFRKPPYGKQFQTLLGSAERFMGSLFPHCHKSIWECGGFALWQSFEVISSAAKSIRNLRRNHWKPLIWAPTQLLKDCSEVEHHYGTRSQLWRCAGSPKVPITGIHLRFLVDVAP